jgi:hypothetical protein
MPDGDFLHPREVFQVADMPQFIDGAFGDGERVSKDSRHIGHNSTGQKRRSKPIKNHCNPGGMHTNFQRSRVEMNWKDLSCIRN